MWRRSQFLQRRSVQLTASQPKPNELRASHRSSEQLIAPTSSAEQSSRSHSTSANDTCNMGFKPFSDLDFLNINKKTNKKFTKSEIKNIKTRFINGLRVTDEKVIKIVERVLIDFNNDIVNSLNKKGSRAVSIHTKTNNVINVIPDKPDLGFVGVPQKIILS